MNYTRLKNFKNFNFTFLYLSVLYFNLLKSSFAQKSLPTSDQEEIKHLFHNIESTDKTNTEVKGVSNVRNFAEGGVVNENTISANSTQDFERSSFKRQSKILLNTNHTVASPESQNVTKLIYNDTIAQSEKKNISYASPLFKQITMTKLNETGANLFLGVPEVVHINGTSSIKPRKGVYFNKIVPRKGVNNENEVNDGNTFINFCIWVNEKCYGALNFQSIHCVCCKENNVLGKIIKEQPLVNCTQCKLMPKKYSCQNICCENNFSELYSTTMINNVVSDHNLFSNISIDKQNVTINYESKNDNVSSKKVDEKNKILKNFLQKLKLKPSITKVPYDVETVTELSSNFTTKNLLPIIISIILLPLIGVPLFFLWRKTKEYWDKRYYKRMDFLIEGMYND